MAQFSNIWKFGNGAGIDFNSGSPVALPTSGMWAFEGTSSMCDASGNLLFYTNGNEVRDRNGNLMPNGSGLSGGTSTTQCITFPKINDCGKYYIFHVTDHAGNGDLRYSIVDMCLNNGLGDVVPTTKNTFLSNPSAEKIAAVRNSNGTDVWVITHDLGNTTFRVFPVTSAGIGPAVLSSIGSTYVSNCMIGSLKASHNGLKIVAENSFCSVTDLFDFNPSTGVLSNYVNLGLGNGFYGAEFSANDQILYLSSTWIVDYLMQVDLTTMVTTQIATINGNYQYGQMQMGPDGKIYMARGTQAFLDVINNPNVLGLGCNYVVGGFNLAAGTFSDMGMPNFLSDIVIPSTVATLPVNLGSDTTLPCSFTPFQISVPIACGATFLWQDGSTLSSFTVTSPGIYWVEEQNACGIGRDSIQVLLAGTGSALVYSTKLDCFGFKFYTDSVSGGSFSWNFGDGNTGQGTSVSYTYGAAGTYVITLFADYGGGCRDTIVSSVIVDGLQSAYSVPNVFTPNNDGVNDEFIITDLVECTPFVLEIYDRWGVLQFKTEHPVFVHWKGESLDGKPVTDGVYYYTLSSTGSSIHGFVNVLR